MENETQKSVSIISTRVADRRKLVELLRSWAEALPPQAAFEIQYTYDPVTKIRGFHLLFSEAAFRAADSRLEAKAKLASSKTRVAA
ncbi:MAG TPA: hypothetical protein VFD30_10160 [Terriglobia bacterium]|jgi:hypothetical protein|nr:hypothetical protein [Terriglobia bacterium]